MRSSSSTAKKPSPAITVHLTMRMPMKRHLGWPGADVHREAQQPGHKQKQDDQRKISIVSERAYQAGASSARPRGCVEASPKVTIS
jgi:hypothetical protein